MHWRAGGIRVYFESRAPSKLPGFAWNVYYVWPPRTWFTKYAIFQVSSNVNMMTYICQPFSILPCDVYYNRSVLYFFQTFIETIWSNLFVCHRMNECILHTSHTLTASDMVTIYIASAIYSQKPRTLLKRQSGTQTWQNFTQTWKAIRLSVSTCEATTHLAISYEEIIADPHSLSTSVFIFQLCERFTTLQCALEVLVF